MMNSLMLENDKKYVRKFFRLQKEIDDSTIKEIRIIFRLEKKMKQLKTIIRDIRILFEQEKEDYYKPVRVDDFWSRNCIEYESNRDRNIALSTEEYLNKIRSYLKDIISHLKKSDTWEIQLTIAINFISSIDTDAEHAMRLKRDNIEIMINDEADKVTEELFQSLLSVTSFFNHFFLDIKLGWKHQ